MNTDHVLQCTDRYELEAHGTLYGIAELPAQEGHVGVRYGGFYLMGKPENPFIYLVEFYENETHLEVVALDQVHPKYTKEAL